MGKFSSVAPPCKPPVSAHPGYDEKDALVEVVERPQTLHFMKDDEGFEVTLYYHPGEDGAAPAISLGSISDERVSEAARTGELVIDERYFRLSDTRRLRRILR